MHVDSANIYRIRADGSKLENLAQGARPQIAPVSGLDWRPLPLLIAAIMMLVASVAFHHGAFQVMMDRVTRKRRKRS
jgi:hypothetical protein